MPFRASTWPYRLVSPEAWIAATRAPTRATLFRVRLLVIGRQEAKLFGPPTIGPGPDAECLVRLHREHVSQRVVGGLVQRVRTSRLAGRECGRTSRDRDQSRGD